MTCSACESPAREVWPPRPDIPWWDRVRVGNWISLESCRGCGSRWVVVCHEPYASFRYSVAWLHSDADFDLLHELDDATTLHQWHTIRIRAAADRQEGVDKEAVDQHRARSYGRNPYDFDISYSEPDLPALLRELRGAG